MPTIALKLLGNNIEVKSHDFAVVSNFLYMREKIKATKAKWTLELYLAIKFLHSKGKKIE